MKDSPEVVFDKTPQKPSVVKSHAVRNKKKEKLCDSYDDDIILNSENPQILNLPRAPPKPKRIVKPKF